MASSDSGCFVPQRSIPGDTEHHADPAPAKRDVHCVLGAPVDIANMSDVLDGISRAASTRERLFISTLNLNFVALVQQDAAFRRSLVHSDLCLADGIAVKYLGRLLGVPIPERVAGSDILNAVWNRPSSGQSSPLKVFFFGGNEQAGSKAAEAVNRHQPSKVVCVGHLYPGFGSIEDMSGDDVITAINNAQPDFLIVALGARKGQAWIMHNMTKLEVPVISHLGATINFLAGTVKRAPVIWQNLGLEWLWRIRQEPVLAGRYWSDGVTLLKLLLTRAAPLCVWLFWHKWQWQHAGFAVQVEAAQLDKTKLVLEGNFTSSHVDVFEEAAAKALKNSQSLSLDLSAVKVIDARAMGSLQLLSETMQHKGIAISIDSIPAKLKVAFRLNGCDEFPTENG